MDGFVLIVSGEASPSHHLLFHLEVIVRVLSELVEENFKIEAQVLAGSQVVSQVIHHAHQTAMLVVHIELIYKGEPSYQKNPCAEFKL